MGVLGIDMDVGGRALRFLLGFGPLIYFLYRNSEELLYDTIGFITPVVTYLATIIIVYIAVFYFTKDSLLKKSPWVGTILFLPPALALYYFGPTPFQLAMSLFFTISFIINAIRKWGGLVVLAIPTALFKTDDTPVYCPINFADRAEKALKH